MIAGIRLKRLREGCGLTYREVERLSRLIAERHRNARYIVRISKLASIEPHGLVPNIFQLYALSMIYSVEMNGILSWYGIPDQKSKESILKWLSVAACD